MKKRLEVPTYDELQTVAVLLPRKVVSHIDQIARRKFSNRSQTLRFMILDQIEAKGVDAAETPR